MSTEKRMSLVEFQKRFGTEEQCREHLFKQRWPDGFVCPKCGSKKYCVLCCRQFCDELTERDSHLKNLKLGKNIRFVDDVVVQNDAPNLTHNSRESQTMQ